MYILYNLSAALPPAQGVYCVSTQLQGVGDVSVGFGGLGQRGGVWWWWWCVGGGGAGGGVGQDEGSINSTCASRYIYAAHRPHIIQYTKLYLYIYVLYIIQAVPPCIMQP